MTPVPAREAPKAGLLLRPDLDVANGNLGVLGEEGAVDADQSAPGLGLQCGGGPGRGHAVQFELGDIAFDPASRRLAVDEVWPLVLALVLDAAPELGDGPRAAAR